MPHFRVIYEREGEEEENGAELLERMGKIGLGCAGGWLLSSVGMQIGKVAAFAGGCGLIVYLVVNNKNRLKKKSNDIGSGVLNINKKLQIELNSKRPENSIVAFFKERDVYLTGGFAAGLLLGISSS